jgi:hypothetical protein
MTYVQAPKPGASVVQTDIACRRCSYNLKGLASPGLCPECGTPFHLGRRYASSFRDVPLVSLKIAATWITGMLVSGLLLGVGLLVALFLAAAEVQLHVLGWVLVPLAGAWVVCVTMVTWPWAAHDDVQRPEPQRRTKPLRVIAWGVSLLAFVGAVLFSLGQTLLWAQFSSSTASIGSISTSMDGLFDAAWMCGAVAYFGLLVLGYYLAAVADWYDDTELSQRFRNSIFLLLVVPLPLMWMIQVPPRGILTGPAWGVACLVLIVLTVLLLRPFFGLAMLAHWACKSADLALGHEARAARKIVQRVDAGKARPDAPASTEVPIPLVKQGMVAHGPVAPAAPIGPASHVKRHPPDPSKKPAL